MAEDFKLLLGAQFDNASVKKALDAIPQSARTVQVEVKGDNRFIKSTVEEGNKLTTTLTRVNTKTGETTQMFERTKVSAEKMNTEIKTATKHTSTLSERFLDITKKVIAFGAVTSLISAFSGIMYKAVDSVKEMDASLTELQKVTDLGGESLKNYTDQAFNMARDLSTSASEVTDAVTEFAKSNYTLEESQALAKQAIIFQTIADGAVSASDSATMLIQVMKAYNMSTEQSVDIINSINEVSNKYAVSSTDLSSSIGRVASSANMAGVEFEQLLGLITGSNEIVQNAGKVANGYKTILTNLMTKDLEDQFNEFGLTMREQNGQLKNGYDMVLELAGVYNTLGTTWSDDEEAMVSMNDSFNELLKSIAGNYNINTLVAGFQNVETTISATASALDSAGSATDEYAVAMESIQKKTDAVSGAFQELVYGEGGLSNFIKLLLDSTTGILSFISNTKALSVVLVDLGIILAINMIPNIAKLGTTLIMMTTTAIPRAIASWELYAHSFISASTAMSASIPIIGLVVVAVSALAMAINNHNQEVEEELKLQQEQTSQTKAQIDTINSALNSLKNETLTREELNSVLDSYDEKLKNEISNIEDVNDARAKSIELLEKEKLANAKSILETGYTGYVSGKEALEEGSFKNFNAGDLTVMGNLTDSEYIEQLKTIKDAYIAFDNESGKYVEVIAKIEAELTKATTAYEEHTKAVNDYTNAQAILTNDDAYISTIERYTQGTNDFGKVVKNATSDTRELEETLAELAQEFDFSTTTIDGLAVAFDTLEKAQLELQDGGELTVDTYSSLMSLGNEYINLLFDENGQLLSTAEAHYKLYNAKIDEMAISKARALVDTATAYYNETGSLVGLSNQLKQTTSDTWLMVQSDLALLTAKGQDVTAIRSQINKLQEWSVSAKKNVSGIVASTSATKSQTDALKEQQDVLEDTKDKYETVIDTILDKYDEEIDKIEELKDAELSRIDDTIDALNAQRDAEEKYWDDKIDALNAQNDAINDQIELQKLQEARALAYSNKVLIMNNQGQFEYGQDESAITSTEEAIDAFTLAQQQEQALALLEQQKNQALASLDAQISAWELYKENLSANFEAQIEAQELLKQNFEDLTTSYEDNQNNLLVQELAGIDLEQANWQSRLENLANFVNEYNKLQAQLGTATTNAKASTSSSSSGTTATTATTTAKKASKYVSTLDRTSGVSNAYASGVSSVGSNQMAIVGENPELVVGSKANGQLMNLAEGTGVVNNGSLKTFAGLINSIGKYSGLNGSTGGVLNNSSSSTTNNNGMTINGDITVVANNPTEFEGYFKSYNSNMLQESYA